MQNKSSRSFFGNSQGYDGPPDITGTVAAGVSRLAFLKKVYSWMFAGIVATVLGGAIAVKSGMAMSMLMMGKFAWILLTVGWALLPLAVQKVRHVPTWNVVAFAGYAAFTGFVISTVAQVAILLAERNGAHGSTYLLQAGALTLVSFGGISAYAFTTKRDFSFLRGFLMAATLVFAAAVLLNFLFIESSMMSNVITVAGVLLFSVSVLYNTQRVMKTYPDGEQVAAALTLYLDFVLLFVYMLRLVMMIAGGGRRD